jgi:hypothetical protein
MLTQTLNLNSSPTSLQSYHSNQALISLPQGSIDSNVQNLALKALNYGECLSWAKYAKYIPGAPDFLKSKALCLIGESCSVVKSGLQIKNKLDSALAFNSSPTAKIKGIAEAAQLALQIANTQFVDYLPKGIKKSVKWLHDACGVAQLGCLFKEKVDEVSAFKNPSLAKTKESLEAARLAVWTASSGLGLIGYGSPAFMTSLTVGYGLLTVAKAGVTAANYIGGLAAPAA